MELSDLSNEILFNVLENLRTSPETLAALTLTSHRFHNLVLLVFELPVRDLYLLHDEAKVTTTHDIHRKSTNALGLRIIVGFESSLINHLRWARRAFLNKILYWLEPNARLDENGNNKFWARLRCGRVHLDSWPLTQRLEPVLMTRDWEEWDLEKKRWQYLYELGRPGRRCTGFTTPWGFTCQPFCNYDGPEDDTWPECRRYHGGRQPPPLRR